jgi:hypothetical protein
VADSNDQAPQTEEEWWKEDAERLNEACKRAREMGIVATPAVKQPELNPDGSVKEGPPTGGPTATGS